jgi:hypothetical protein
MTMRHPSDQAHWSVDLSEDGYHGAQSASSGMGTEGSLRGLRKQSQAVQASLFSFTILTENSD